MLYRYSDLLKENGSAYRVARDARQRGLIKVSPGIYSSSANPSPNAIACTLYPQAVLTMDSAFYLHGLTDVIPRLVHIATPRNSTRIKRPQIRQYFTDARLMSVGVREIVSEDGPIRVFSRERMLVELLRSSAKLPPDYYRELVASYRKIVEELDMYEVEDALDLYKRADGLFDKLQGEIL